MDVLIGTHRLLQRDVRFADLGLVIIDEEQRFGVAAKEHLKRLRELVDVLTLSATPIPRTLYLSLTGARDMSLIQTPPRERLAIETYIAQDSDELLREVILREVNAAGRSSCSITACAPLSGCASGWRACCRASAWAWATAK